MKRSISMLAVALAFVAAVGTGVFALGSSARTFSIPANGPNLTGTYSGKFSGKAYIMGEEGAKPRKVKGTFTLVLTAPENSDRGDGILNLMPVGEFGNKTINAGGSETAFGNGIATGASTYNGAFSVFINKKLKKIKGNAVVMPSSPPYDSWVIKLTGNPDDERLTATLTDGATFDIDDSTERTYTEGTANIPITAPAPGAGLVFDTWTSTPPGVVFDSPNNTTTTFTMPGNDVEITPTYMPE